MKALTTLRTEQEREPGKWIGTESFTTKEGGAQAKCVYPERFS
jgi:hypothetical protein